MAEDETGKLVDPFLCAADLKAGILRHVSPAFSESPVSILRVARFAARFANRNFQVADETPHASPSCAAWSRTARWIISSPSVCGRNWKVPWTQRCRRGFFEVLRECGALKRLFPELERLYGVPQPENIIRKSTPACIP